MSQDAATADPSSSEAVEELLRQLVDARFVLTDRDGAVTRWSRPAEVLFGWPAEGMVGRPLVKTLGLPDNLPESGGQLTAMVRCQDGEELEVAMGLVPVRMSHSLEFNGFLEALEIVAPRGDALSALGRSHRTVVDWIQAALNGEAELDDDGLAAGTIIAFRPLHEPPPEPALEELELAAAEADLEEAAQAQERLASLEQAGAGLESELADTRRALDEMRAQLDQTREKLKALEAAHAQEQSVSVRIDEVQGRLASFESALSETPGTETIEEATRALRAEFSSERTRFEEELAGTRARLEQLEAEGSAGRSELEAELAETRERLQEQERARDHVQGKLEALEQAAAEREADGTSAQAGLATGLNETREAVEALRAGIEAAQVEAVGDEEARLLINDLREELGALRSGVLERGVDESRLRALVEQAQSSADAARQSQEAMKLLAGQAAQAAEAAQARAERAEQAIAAGAERDAMTASAAREELTQLEARAAQAHESAGATVAAIGSEAARAQGLVSAMLLELDERAGDIREWLAGADTSAGRTEAATEQASRAIQAVEAAIERAREADAKVEAHAERAGEAESHVRRMAEAAAAAERRAAEAQEAATSAAEAAELARRSAAEAGAEAEAVRRTAYGAAQAKALEAPSRLTPLDGRERPVPANGKPGSRHQRPLFAKRTREPQREPRPGFDDAGHPMATMELNGHFRELNRDFCDLVGHSEEEFRAAVWPPVMDRANLPKHREQMKQLLDGGIDTASFDTSYVHAQGLLVPLAGCITLVERDGGPDHFLLDVRAPSA